MRKVELDIYSFNELDDKAKDRARDWFKSGDEFPYFNDYLDSIRAFCDQFDITLKDWCIGDSYRAFLKTNAEPKHFRGYTLKQAKAMRIDDDLYCGESLKRYFVDSFALTGNAFQAFNEAMNSIQWDIKRDVEYYYSDDSVDEMITINEYEFFSSGKIYH